MSVGLEVGVFFLLKIDKGLGEIVRLVLMVGEIVH